MSGVFMVVMTASGVWALTHGRAEEMGMELLAAGDSAVRLMLMLAGGYMIWSGLLKILENSGAIRWLSHRMQRPVRLLLGKDVQEQAALEAVCVNFAANLLGLGNAATPAGLRAMEHMAGQAKDGRPTHGMCMFLLLNASSLQLIPTTVLSLRAAYGAANPGDILLPTLAGSAAATLTAVLLGVLCRRAA